VVENADVRQVEQQKDGFTECTAETRERARAGRSKSYLVIEARP
jgi:hypothetical protein